MSAKTLAMREWVAIEELSAFLSGVFRSKEESIDRVLKLKDSLNAAMYPGEPEPKLDVWEAADKEANRLLASYTTMPVLTRDDEGYSFIEQTLVILPDHDLDWLEARAVRQVMYLANQCVLHQLTACGNCKAIFLPKRAGQKNCSATCSKKAYEGAPDFRKKRNEWARESYRSAKERDAANLKAADGAKKHLQRQTKLRGRSNAQPRTFARATSGVAGTSA